jgi:hypothetical protein
MQAVLYNKDKSKSVEVVVSSPPPLGIKRLKNVWDKVDSDLIHWPKEDIIFFKFRETLVGSHIWNDVAVYDQVDEEVGVPTKEEDALMVEIGNKIGVATMQEITKIKMFAPTQPPFHKIVDAHKAAFGYGPDVEKLMVEIGNKNPAKDAESIYDYLTRLLYLAKPEATKPVDWKSITSSSDTIDEDSWNKQQAQYEYETQLKMYQNKLAEYEHQKMLTVNQYTQQTLTQPMIDWPNQYKSIQPGIAHTQSSPNAFPPIYYPPMSVPPQYLQPGAMAKPAETEIAPEPEKPKRDLPDPIEPQKRFMKK